MLAVLAATLAGLANLAVASKTGVNQLDLQKSKNEEEKIIEKSKAKSARILEVVKASDPDKAAQNLTFLLDAGLITDEARKAEIRTYLSNRKGGQGVNIQVSSAPPNSQAPVDADGSKPTKPDTSEPSSQPTLKKTLNVPGRVFTYTTGWLPGGHDQAEACSEGIATAMAQNPGQKFKVLSSTEESRKDILGHVTYRYNCVIQEG